MDIKTNKEMFKEKINPNNAHSKIRIVNEERLKHIRALKNSRDLRYCSENIKPDIKSERGKVKSGRSNIRRRTQTLTGNMIFNSKDAIKCDPEETSSGIQAIIYASDKFDTAADVFIGSKRIVQAVRNTRNTVRDSKNINVVNLDNGTVISNEAKGQINKKYLLKQLSKKGVKGTAKSAFRVTRNVETNVSQSLTSEETDLGIRSVAHVEKEIRRTVDTVKTANETSAQVVKTSTYIKNKIYSQKNKSYSRVKDNIQKNKSDKIRTKQNIRTSKVNKVNSPNIIRAKNQINRKFIGDRVADVAKRSIVGIANSIKAVIMLKNPMAIVAVGLAIFLLMMNASSSSIVSMLSQQYFMADEDIALKYKDKVEILDNELRERISDLKDDNKYDSTKVVYIGDNHKISTNFNEIFAIASVKYEQNLTYSNNEKKFIDKIYSEIYDIKISTENYTITNSEGKEITKKRKIITVYSYDMETVMNKINFDDEQERWARTLVSNFSEQFPELAIQYGELTQEEINDLIKNAPKFTLKQQEKLYDAALSLVGKVKYFWGGKSSVGWNDEWGRSTLVTSPGNDTTGKYRPFGLDCSGYVDWVYKTSGIGNVLSGGGTSYQWGQSYPINNDDLQVGDLAFLQMPNSSGVNHVGIYMGTDKNNNNLYVHCQWGTGVTVDGYKGFKYFRRVVRFE